MEELYNIFEELKENNSEVNDIIFVRDIPSRANHKIGVSFDGRPLFFIATKSTQESAIDINLKLIQVAFQKDCELISREGQNKNGVYTIVSLNTDSEDIIKYFINTMHYLIIQLGVNPSFAEIKSELNILVNLFRSMSNSPKRTIKGLWTELLFINESKDIEYVIDCWHHGKEDRYDFNNGVDKVEIKSTSKNDRIHRFNLSQLQEVKDALVVIGSAFTIETGDGLSVSNLIELIEKKVSTPRLMIKIHTIIAEVIGDKFDQIFDTYFDYSLAASSVLFFDIREVPRINNDAIPSGVLNVKFDCILNQENSLKKEEVFSKLLNALM